MKFKSERYPQLRVGVTKGKYARFVDGELDTTDKDAIDALKKLPEEYGVKAVGGRPSKGDKSADVPGDGDAPNQGDSPADDPDQAKAK